MTTAKRATPEPERLTLTAHGEGMLRAVWHESVVRFMFDDGSTVDVLTARDDSELRGVLLKQLGKGAIVGSTRLPTQPSLLDDA